MYRSAKNSAGRWKALTVADVEMPALIGDDPLGFLAALGVLRLAVDELGWDATLAWPSGPRNGAILSNTPTDATADSLVERLSEVAATTLQVGRLIPSVDGFPPLKTETEGSDPVKDLSFDERNALAIASGFAGDDGRMTGWLLATFSLGATPMPKSDARDRLTAGFVRPTGQVTFDRSLRSGLKDATADHLSEALHGWVRRDGVTGHYFDQRAIRDEFVGMHTSGQMKNAGVPGASWLALMALPMFPVRTNDRLKAATVAFRKRPRQPGRLVWPIWSSPLDITGVRALLDHPDLQRLGRDHEAEAAWMTTRRLRNLGVSAMYVSERQPGPQGGDAALGASQLLASG
jgi:hypothetical protein